jgi:hypothetical protein
MGQMIDHPLADPGADHFAEFEAETIDNMLLLNRRLAQPEQTRLGVIFAERRAALADFSPSTRSARDSKPPRLAAGGVSRGQLSLIELGS